MYSTSGVDWKGNSAIRPQTLPRSSICRGPSADAVRLLRDIENVSKLYRSRGYMPVHVKPDAQLNEEKSMVHYDLNVAEGDLYKMGELEILGLDTQAKARMRAAWTLRKVNPITPIIP